jgi:hypothetical protein
LAPNVPAKPRAPRRSRATSRAKEPDFPLVYVKFHDHCWLEAKDLKKINVAKPYVIEETGFLLREDPKFITVAKERSTDGEKGKTSYDDVTIIMRSDILEMEVFRRAGR